MPNEDSNQLYQLNKVGLYSKKFNNCCPVCSSQDFAFIGKGTERIGEIISEDFKKNTWVRIDSDSFKKKGELDEIFKKVSENPKTKIEISIEQKSVACEEIEFNFSLDDFSQNRILNGIDKIDISLEFEEKIDEFMQSRNKWAPKLT